MCRVASVEFDSATAAVPEARAFVVATLRRWDLDALIDDAVLLTSELVTNAVVHARSRVGLVVAVADGLAEVGVSDSSPALPTSRSTTWAAEGGRGLVLVEMLAREWGSAHTDTGKQVWFRLDAGRRWGDATDCPCDGASLDAVRLESGRMAVHAHGPWDPSS